MTSLALEAQLPLISERSTEPLSDFAPDWSGPLPNAKRTEKVAMTENRTLSALKEFGSLINTGLILVTACGLIYKWGSDTTEVNARITALENAIAKMVVEDGRRWEAHADLHKERSTDIAKREGSVDARLSRIEETIESDGRRLDNGIYRIGILEDARKGDAAIIRDVQKTVTDLAGDMKVVLRGIQQTNRQQ